MPVKVVVGNSSSRPAAYSYNQTVLVSYYYCHTSDFTNLDTCAILLLTRRRASTSILWHFAFALCCHSNENRAQIANPPNNAQLRSTPAISQVKFSLHSNPCSSAGMRQRTDRYTRTHTHTQTDTHAWPIYISRGEM